MAIDDRLNQIHAMQGELREMQQEWRQSGGGGGGGGMDMDRRVARLEGQFDKLDTKIDGLGGRVGGVEVQLATLTERVAHLPSKGFIVTALATTIAVVSGLAAIARGLGFFG
jgi:hypothetical protein